METTVTSAAVRTFLIADIRGYTTFTLERGDEAAARLTAHFAELAQEVVAARGGQVIELRGDEALAVFSSPRQALRAAADLQQRTGQETMADTFLPLKLGIGLDAGEAIPVEGGYRGTALNLAARLCALAGPGEVLSSEAVTHLARKVEGLEYAERGLVELKGFSDPVKVIQVLPETQRQRPEQTGQLHGTYRVQLLGPFALLHDDGVIDTSRWQRRVGSLLKLLLTAPGKRRIRDELIDLLWPDAEPEAGAANLRLLTYRVRQALGNPDPPAVLSDRSWVTINPRYHWEMDLDRFEELAARADDDIAKLEEAASLYGGEPLPEDRYDDWAMPIRERVQRRWRDLCLQLAARYRADGSAHQAVDWYERILQSDPLDEDAVQGLLAVLVELGKRTDALRRYRQFEQRLAQELDLPPQPETLALVKRIEDRITQPVPQSEPGGTERMRELVPVIPTYPLPIAGPLIGREAELQEILAALPDMDSAQTPGSPGAASVRLVLLAAEAGMGKTRLLAEIARRAREAGTADAGRWIL